MRYISVDFKSSPTADKQATGQESKFYKANKLKKKKKGIEEKEL